MFAVLPLFHPSSHILPLANLSFFSSFFFFCCCSSARCSSTDFPFFFICIFFYFFIFFFLLFFPPPPGSGQIDAQEFYKLMQDCNGDMADSCSEHDVQRFMHDLDRDGNGLLDLDEFVAFIVTNLSMTPEERIEYRDTSPLQRQLSDMMIAMTDKISQSLGKGDGTQMLGKSLYNNLPDKMERRIQHVVERLYKQYDDDDSDSIDSEEFLKLMLDVMQVEEDSGEDSEEDEEEGKITERMPTLDDALKFIKVIASTRMNNVDQESSLQKQDFLTFTLKVLTSSSKQRISFGARSRMHHKLLSFFLLLITDSLNVLESDLDRQEFDKKEQRAEIAEANQKKRKKAEAEAKAKAEAEAEQVKEEAKRTAMKQAEMNKELELKRIQKEKQRKKKEERENAVNNEVETKEEIKEETRGAEPTTKQQPPPPLSGSPPPVNAEQITKGMTEEEEQHFLMSRLDMYTMFVWDQYDIDKDGSLDATEFETFLRVITQRGDAITSEDCQRFLRQMDRSGDGKLQRDELVAFAGSGFEMGPEESKEYSGRSLMHELLVVFVNKLRDAILNDSAFETQVKVAGLVENVWKKYDTDLSGSLEPEEVRLLISEVMTWDGSIADEVTLEEATRFIGFLDPQKTGAVDQVDFKVFICNAMAMSTELRIQFAQRSPMHAKVRFPFLISLFTFYFYVVFFFLPSLTAAPPPLRLTFFFPLPLSPYRSWSFVQT